MQSAEAAVCEILIQAESERTRVLCGVLFLSGKWGIKLSEKLENTRLVRTFILGKQSVTVPNIRAMGAHRFASQKGDAPRSASALTFGGKTL